MFEKIFWAAVGALIMRYIILKTPDYKTKEAEKIDQVSDDVKTLVKRYKM